MHLEGLELLVSGLLTCYPSDLAMSVALIWVSFLDFYNMFSIKQEKPKVGEI